MRKGTAVLLLLLMVSILLCGCTGGEVARVRKSIGESEIYSSAEIERAMNVVIGHFKSEFEGCTLTELVYNDETSVRLGEGKDKQYGADEVIVLTSTFEVDSTGGDGSLLPDSTYSDFGWVLTRSNGGSWKLQTWGYG